jgi:putative copper resistance protein D
MAATSHAIAAGSALLPRATVYAVHLIASAVWLGGLVPFAVALHGARGAEPAGVAAASRTASRFSMLALVAVAALVITGIVNAVMAIGSLRGLLTAYSALLGLKLALFAMMLGLVNRAVLVPRMRDDARVAMPLLVRNAVLELALGIAVVLVAVRLGASPPPAAS